MTQLNTSIFSSSKKKKQLRAYRVSPGSKRKLDKLLGSSPIDTKRNLKSIKEEVKSITEKLKLLSLKDGEVIMVKDNLDSNDVAFTVQRTVRRKKIVLSPEKIYEVKRPKKKHMRNKSTIIFNKKDTKKGFYLQPEHRRSASKGTFKTVKNRNNLDIASIRKFVVSDNFDSTCKIFLIFLVSKTRSKERMESFDFNNLCLKNQSKRIFKRKSGADNWKDIFKRSVSQARKNMLKNRRLSNGQMTSEVGKVRSKSKKPPVLHRKSYSIQSQAQDPRLKTCQNFTGNGSSGTAGAGSPSKLYYKGGKRPRGKSIRNYQTQRPKTIRPSFTVKVDLSTYVSPKT